MKINATPKYSPARCFKGKNIYYRDSDLVHWLPREMPAVPEGDTKMFVTRLGQKFKQMLKDFTGSEEVKDEYIFSLKQIEMMLEEPEKYELRTDGYENFFPISKEFMLYARRSDGGQWLAHVYGLDDGHEWFADRRLLLRNAPSVPSDTLTLDILWENIHPMILTINGVVYVKK